MTQGDIHECCVQCPKENTDRRFFYCNQAHQIGIIITPQRIDGFESGFNGDLEFFVQLVQDEEAKGVDCCPEAFEYQITEDIRYDDMIVDDVPTHDQDRIEQAALTSGSKKVELDGVGACYCKVTRI
jgi:hypothetical protein